MSGEPTAHRKSVKLIVARALKWNMVDKVSQQLLYLVTGIVLARVLPEHDFGLVGAVMVFQSFAALFVDSGFSYALIQRKNPTQTDYSTVFWFNLTMALSLYLILFLCAPLIADCYGGDPIIIPLSRVIFLTFILNATSIVQINRRVKNMDVKIVAAANSAGVFSGAVTGIAMALTGFGVWALAAQAIVLAAVKSIVMWVFTPWRPSVEFSFKSLRSIFKVGMGVMGSATLNVIFQNIYSFIIGNRKGILSLSYYYQADKWSLMGISSLSGMLNTTFLPVMSKYQDDKKEFAAVGAKFHRLAAYLAFPAMGMLMMMAAPIFHALFDNKWDLSIAIFQMLLARGVFTILTSVYNNYIIALGKARLMFYAELLRDVVALIAIFITLPMMMISMPDDFMYGVRIFVVGQIAASFVTWIVTLFIIARQSQRPWWQYLADLLPYIVETLAAMLPMWLLMDIIANPWLLAGAQLAAGLTVYIGFNFLLRSKVQSDAITFLINRSNF